MNTPGDLSARQAELDARTIYDIACIREARSDATREDVDFKAIALRNWQHVTAAVSVEALEGLVAEMDEFLDAEYEPNLDTIQKWSNELAQLIERSKELIKERSNGAP